MVLTSKSSNPKRIESIIKRKIYEALNPVKLIIEDKSHLHIGHSGYKEGGQSHFKILIVSDHFLNKSKVERQRIVYKILSNEFKEDIHALSIIAITAEESNDIKYSS